MKTVTKVALGTVASALAAAAGAKIAGRQLRRRGAEFPGVAQGSWPPADGEAFEVETRDGGTIRGTQRGPVDATTVVLLHGITLARDVWRNQFADLDPSLRVIAIDLRGFGESVAGERGHSVEALGNDVADVLERLDVRDAVVVGHSMGGMALCEFLAGHPEVRRARVRGAVLFSSSTNSPVTRAVGNIGHLLDPLARWADAHGGLPDFDDDVSYLMVAKIAFGKHPEADDVELTRALSRAASLVVTQEFGASILEYDRREALDSVSGLPVVVLHGTNDRIIPVGAAYTSVKHLVGARLEILPGCGHMPMLERRERVAEVLHSLAGVPVR